MKISQLNMIRFLAWARKITWLGVLLLVTCVSCAGTALAVPAEPPDRALTAPAATAGATDTATAATASAADPAAANADPTAASADDGGDAASTAAENFVLRYTLNRSAVPALTYNALTLKIYIGSAGTVRASENGKTIPSSYDPQTGYLTVTATSTRLEVFVGRGTFTSQTGSFTKAALKDDRSWAWSHSFDDNVEFEDRGISAFDQYDWRATVYLIGGKIDDTRQENWIIDRPDIIALVKKGWGIGNHTWSHGMVSDTGGSSGTRQDIILLSNYLREAVDEAGWPDYRLMSFAAPMFDSDYHPIILNMRDTGTTELLFNESGEQGFLRVDAGVTGEDEPIFDPDHPIGRDWRMEAYGDGSDFDHAFRANLNDMLARLDANHHFWLNTFTHRVDHLPSDLSIFAFLPWLYDNYGPGGDDSVWVAPAEEIYSYLLVRDKTKVTYVRMDSSWSDTFMPMVRSK